MGFPDKVADEAFAKCGRCCCICHTFCGTKMELHHIRQKAYGGEDTLENCIPLCFNCHADMGKGDPKHPKGKRYTETELRMHRDNWYEKVASGKYLQTYQELDELIKINISNVEFQLDIPAVEDGYGGSLHGSYGSFLLEIINRGNTNIVVENIHCAAYSGDVLLTDNISCYDKADYKIVARSRQYKAISAVPIQANNALSYHVKLILSGDYSACDKVVLSYSLWDSSFIRTVYLKQEETENE